MFYRIGQVSRQVGLTEKRIREYEDEGLLHPRRRESSVQRQYDDFDIRRIRQIKALIHERGLTLAGIKALLAIAPCWEIIDCEDRENCPAYKDPWKKCWELREELRTDLQCMGNCNRCPKYLTRDTVIQPMFDRIPPAQPER